MNSLQKARTRGRLADTRWEPRGVYAHLDRLEAPATAGGNLRSDALDPTHHFTSLPL